MPTKKKTIKVGNAPKPLFHFGDDVIIDDGLFFERTLGVVIGMSVPEDGGFVYEVKVMEPVPTIARGSSIPSTEFATFTVKERFLTLE